MKVGIRHLFSYLCRAAKIESSETGGFIFKIGYRFASNAIRYCLDGMLMLGFLNRNRHCTVMHFGILISGPLPIKLTLKRKNM